MNMWDAFTPEDNIDKDNHSNKSVCFGIPYPRAWVKTGNVEVRGSVLFVSTQRKAKKSFLIPKSNEITNEWVREVPHLVMMTSVEDGLSFIPGGIVQNTDSSLVSAVNRHWKQYFDEDFDGICFEEEDYVGYEVKDDGKFCHYFRNVILLDNINKVNHCGNNDDLRYLFTSFLNRPLPSKSAGLAVVPLLLYDAGDLTLSQVGLPNMLRQNLYKEDQNSFILTCFTFPIRSTIADKNELLLGLEDFEKIKTFCYKYGSNLLVKLLQDDRRYCPWSSFSSLASPPSTISRVSELPSSIEVSVPLNRRESTSMMLNLLEKTSLSTALESGGDGDRVQQASKEATSLKELQSDNILLKFQPNDFEKYLPTLLKEIMNSNDVLNTSRSTGGNITVAESNITMLVRKAREIEKWLKDKNQKLEKALTVNKTLLEYEKVYKYYESMKEENEKLIKENRFDTKTKADVDYLINYTKENLSKTSKGLEHKKKLEDKIKLLTEIGKKYQWIEKYEGSGNEKKLKSLRDEFKILLNELKVEPLKLPQEYNTVKEGLASILNELKHLPPALNLPSGDSVIKVKVAVDKSSELKINEKYATPAEGSKLNISPPIASPREDEVSFKDYCELLDNALSKIKDCNDKLETLEYKRNPTSSKSIEINDALHELFKIVSKARGVLSSRNEKLEKLKSLINSLEECKSPKPTPKAQKLREEMRVVLGISTTSEIERTLKQLKEIVENTSDSRLSPNKVIVKQTQIYNKAIVLYKQWRTEKNDTPPADEKVISRLTAEVSGLMKELNMKDVGDINDSIKLLNKYWSMVESAWTLPCIAKIREANGNSPAGSDRSGKASPRSETKVSSPSASLGTKDVKTSSSKPLSPPSSNITRPVTPPSVSASPSQKEIKVNPKSPLAAELTLIYYQNDIRRIGEIQERIHEYNRHRLSDNVNLLLNITNDLQMWLNQQRSVYEDAEKTEEDYQKSLIAAKKTERSNIPTLSKSELLVKMQDLIEEAGVAQIHDVEDEIETIQKEVVKLKSVNAADSLLKPKLNKLSLLNEAKKYNSQYLALLSGKPIDSGSNETKRLLQKYRESLADLGLKDINEVRQCIDLYERYLDEVGGVINRAKKSSPVASVSVSRKK